MSNKDELLQSIKAGKGLPPLNPQASSNSSGLATEQRSEEPGLRIERNSLNQQESSKGNRHP